jgi:hypothetical protein
VAPHNIQASLATAKLSIKTLERFNIPQNLKQEALVWPLSQLCEEQDNNSK